MFGTNLGLHVIKNPAGTYSFVGSIPRALGNQVKPTSDDIIAGRYYETDNGEILTTKFPVFGTYEEAVLHAKSRGYEVIQD